MKSLITKRQLLFVILVLLCGINPIYADTSKELYVSNGNLSDLLPKTRTNYEPLTMINYKIKWYSNKQITKYTLC